MIRPLHTLYFWCLTNYEEATQTVMLVLLVSVLLSMPILIAFLVGLRP